MKRGGNREGDSPPPSRLGESGGAMRAPPAGRGAKPQLKLDWVQCWASSPLGLKSGMACYI